jgi:hypothetical protein
LPPKRWTVLIVSHDSEAPRSIAVTQRALRVVTSFSLLLGLAALVGLGSAVARIGRISRPIDSLRVQTSAVGESEELLSLRERAAGLRGALDSVRGGDARLRAHIGVPSVDTSTLLRRLQLRLPGFLRVRREQAPVFPQRESTGEVINDTLANRRAASAGVAAADSLIDHAVKLSERLRGLGQEASAVQSGSSSARLATGGTGEPAVRLPGAGDTLSRRPNPR